MICTSEDKKMKIFLNGGGDGEQTAEARKRFSEVIDHSKPLLYIPLAMENDMYDSCYEWIKGEMKDVDLPAIEMVRSAEELVEKKLKDYCAMFFGGGNTFKLLRDLKASGAFEKIKEYIKNDGVIFGGSAGAIIFGESLEACKLDDANEVGLEDVAGFDVFGGISLLCHYTNSSAENLAQSKAYLLELSKRKKIIALPEENTIFINGNEIEIIGTRPYYSFENGELCENGSVTIK